MDDFVSNTIQLSYTYFAETAYEHMRNRLGEAAKDIKPKSVYILRQNCPVLSGETKESARATNIVRNGPGSTGFYFFTGVGNDKTRNKKGVSYPQFPNFGTRYIKAQNFMAKSAEQISEYAGTVIEDSINKYITDIGSNSPEKVEVF